MIEVVFDTETTGLVKPLGTALELHPHIIEIAVLRFENGKLQDKLNTLIKPPVLIPRRLTRNVHGISDDMVKDAPVFKEIRSRLSEIFSGCDVVIAQNLTFDEEMVNIELQRLNGEKLYSGSDSFLKNISRFCTIEQSMHLRGYRMKNKELYKAATGKEIKGSHRAYNDALATYEIYKWLKK